MTNQISKGKIKRPMSLAKVLFLVVAGSITIGLASISYFALQTVYSNKLRDIWTILFLDLEQKGHRLAGRAAVLDRALAGAKPLAEIELSEAALRVVFAPKVLERSFQDLVPGVAQLRADLENLRVNVLSLGGKPYFVKKTGQVGEVVKAAVWDAQNLALNEHLPVGNGSLSYVMNRLGHLIWASGDLGPKPVERPVVQAFIGAPLNQGQLEFKSSAGPIIFGFFQEVPGTNLVLFSEKDRSLALVAVRDVAVGFGGFVLATLLVTFLLVNYPINLVIRPIKELKELAAEVAAGKFGRAPRHRGIGEIAVLTQSFAHMSDSLVKRDQEIARLMEEQRHSIHLEHELKVARSFQEILIAHQKLPREAHLDIEVRYKSASEVAGDWYGYFFDRASQETIILQCDVTGHGAGSAMVTAMVASLFESYRADAACKSIEYFMTHLNHCLFSIGRGVSTATAFIARISRQNETLSFANSGHPCPLMVSADGSTRRLNGGRSDNIIGLNQAFAITAAQVPFGKGDRLLVYTDGILGNPKHKESVVSPRAMLLAMKDRRELGSMLDGFVQQASQMPEVDRDDICALGIRAS